MTVPVLVTKDKCHLYNVVGGSNITAVNATASASRSKTRALTGGNWAFFGCSLPVILLGLVISIKLLSAVWIWTIYVRPSSESCLINILKPVRNVSEEFLSLGLDTVLIQDGSIQDNLRSKKLQQRAAIFSPAYIRVGGTTADSLIFDPSDEKPNLQAASEFIDGGVCAYEEQDCINKPEEFIMSGQDWLEINRFTVKTGLKLLFDLNVLLRNGTRWNSTNARELLNFSYKHGLDAVWQLGNEPNSFQHVFQITVNGHQLGEDFRTLRKLLNSLHYGKSKLVGPDVTRPKDLQEESVTYLKDFLSSVGSNTLDAITWHQYYVNGRTTTEADFIDPEILNVLQKQIKAIKGVVDQFSPNTSIWLSETSSAYGGGAPGLSDRFLAGFLWLDKLGVSARMGIDVVIRQTLLNGHYALLDPKTFEPRPDWWLSVIFKTFVGRTVLSLGPLLPQGRLRLYCHCTHPNSLLSSANSITIYGMNLKNQSIHIQLPSFPTLFMSPAYVSAYVLTGADELTSKSVLLNGKLLKLNPDGSLPPFIPVFSHISTPLTLPPFSLFFLVVHGLDIPACKHL